MFTFQIGNVEGGFHGFHFRLLGDIVARFVFIRMGPSDGVERGEVWRGAGRAVSGLAREAYRVFP